MTSQIQVGSTIPTVNVKELAADKSEPLVLKGKNIIVRTILRRGLPLIRGSMDRSACRALSLVHVMPRYLSILSGSPNFRKRA
jgi:hypothetical protein